MSLQHNFLKHSLIILLVFIMCLYFKQQTGFKNQINNKKNKTNTSVNIKTKINQNKTKQKENNIISSNQQLCSNKRRGDLVEFTNEKHCLGPIRNFHQSFNQCNIKDLGWRKWWFKNMNKNNLCEPNNFQPIMKNFLKNQENTKNIYF